VECVPAHSCLSTASRHDRCHLHSLTTCDADHSFSSSGLVTSVSSRPCFESRTHSVQGRHSRDDAIPASFCSDGAAKEEANTAPAFCLCVLSTMWFKAILWPLLYMVLLLVLVRVAKPAIAGWPDSLDDEDVNTPAMKWWKALELAAVVCKYPTACSYVSLLSMTVTAHQACGPQGCSL